MYNVVRVGTDKASLAQSQAVLCSAFPQSSKFTLSYLQWQYALNPLGQIVGYNALAADSQEAAAHYVCQPMRAVINGVAETGLLSLNTATHPRHQGKGLFTKLAQSTFQSATEESYTFVVGVANQNSTAGFVKKLGFQLVAPLVAKIGYGPLPLFEPPRCDSFAPMWTEDALRWRLSNPTGKYDIRSGIVWSATDWPFINVALGECSGFFDLVGRLDARAPIHIWMGLDSRFASSYRYINVPDRFRPSPLNLIFKDLTGNGRRLDPEGVTFWAIDFDPY